MKRIKVYGPCWNVIRCTCSEKDGSDPETEGYPPFHKGCMCVVEETAEGKDVLFIDGPKAGETIRVPGTGRELPSLQAAPQYRSHKEVGEGIRYVLSRRKDGQWIGTLDTEGS